MEQRKERATWVQGGDRVRLRPVLELIGGWMMWQKTVGPRCRERESRDRFLVKGIGYGWVPRCLDSHDACLWRFTVKSLRVEGC
jgi:hypothetical protein